jgi:hypothetical protein
MLNDRGDFSCSIPDGYTGTGVYTNLIMWMLTSSVLLL